MLSSVAHPPLPAQEFLPEHPPSLVLQPPCPLQEFWPAQECFAMLFSIDFLCFLECLAGFAAGVSAAGAVVPAFVSSAYAAPERSAAENTPAEMRVLSCFLVMMTPFRCLGSEASIT